MPGRPYGENIKLLSGISDNLTTDTVSKMTNSAEYNANWNTSVTTQKV